MAGDYRQRTSLLRATESFSIEGGDLVRRMEGGRETRWPLARLRRAAVARRAIGLQARRLTLQLSFAGRRGVVLTSHSVEGVGRFDDQTVAFKAFCRQLLDRATAEAPHLRLERSGVLTASALWWTIGALACGALVVAGSALAGGATTLGLDLGARLIFLLLLAACLLPWMTRATAGLDSDGLLAD
jgi:hypothetical protein